MMSLLYISITVMDNFTEQSSRKSRCLLLRFHAIKKTMRYNIIRIKILFNHSHPQFSFRKGSANPQDEHYLLVISTNSLPRSMNRTVIYFNLISFALHKCIIVKQHSFSIIRTRVESTHSLEQSERHCFLSNYIWNETEWSYV